MSFHAFVEKSNQKLTTLDKTLEIIEWDLQCLRHRITTPELTTEKEKKVIEKKLDVEQARVEKLAAELALLTNLDELAKLYLAKLPANRKRIDLSYSIGGRSLTIVPDLSKFTELRDLDLSHNEEIQGGFDRLPATLRNLCVHKLKANGDVNDIRRLVHLETLDMTRNDSVTELPDLSGLTNLKELHLTGCWGLKRLPCLPMSLKAMTLPNTPAFNVYFSEGESLWLNHASQSQYRKVESLIYQRKLLRNWMVGEDEEQPLCKYGAFRNERLDKRILQINRVNRFDAIRDELLEQGAKLCLLPSRIERLLENGGGANPESRVGVETLTAPLLSVAVNGFTLDENSNWLDIYDLQERRTYSTEYGW